MSSRGQRTRRPQSREDERLAFEVVARTLGVEVEPYDIPPRQGVVDALLHYADGKEAALEVSSIGPREEAEICKVLATKANGLRRPPGLKSSWFVRVPRDFKRSNLRKIDDAVLRCETYRSPTFMAAIADDNVRALVVSGVKGNRYNGASSSAVIQVEPEYLGGFTSRGSQDLTPEFNTMLRSVEIQRKIDKLAASGCPERHLFLHVRPSAFSFPVYDALAWGGPLPDEPPSLPIGLDQVWLVSLAAGGVVRAIAGRGWCRTDAPA